MGEFSTLVYTAAGSLDPGVAIAACRAGGIGVLNGELAADGGTVIAALELLAAHAGGPFGLKLDAARDEWAPAVRRLAPRGLRWLILDAEILAACGPWLQEARAAGVCVLAEVRSGHWPERALADAADGLVLKGNEAGGLVGEDGSFILVQKWLQRTRLPLFVRGGVTPHSAAACAAVGIAGCVLDSQLLLMEESRLPEDLAAVLGNLSGSEALAVGDAAGGEFFRFLSRPGFAAARRFAEEAEGLSGNELRERARGRGSWQDPANGILPIGQDVLFAAAWKRRYGSVAGVLQAIRSAVDDHAEMARRCAPIAEDAPLARALGVRFPIIQGPMTRVSDTAEFALAVADGGALPMLALAVLRGPPLADLLRRTSELLGTRAWGIGLLGFAPQELLDEQLAAAARYAPRYAIIAGGRPDQAVELERRGVPTFLHVPSARLVASFLRDGARRFIFEGRECGGHVGPLSSFVLWSSMVDQVLAELADSRVPPGEIELIFAGGIHDAVSSAMLQVLTAPLAAAGVRIGILMGSAYLFTREIVATGSIVPQFQEEALACERTVNLESGVGHASRCAVTPFAQEFCRQRVELRRGGTPAEECRARLDDLILGRLRIASKGRKREGAGGALQTLEATQQREQGMYMLGQVATLRHTVTDIAALHGEVTAGAAELLARERQARPADAQENRAGPADVAIIGMACVFPGAGSLREYWENILGKVDAITEIPASRWDWRTYFDADPKTRDRIYARWGGFLDDVAFDPTQYGMPPKSIESVDPMQLLALEVARRTLGDSGYAERPFDRERAAVILGASGGIGDVGIQYGLRAELPRFTGALPEELAARLPQWTEDSFAGILPNVAAGRIANRLNFGGMNLTTDAACASSLAAVYQAVTELCAGRSDFVIAGGVDTTQGPFGYLCFSKTHALSPRGRCATFDADADGIVISEGIAMVALKRLADAQRDGDRIYAVIKGAGASSDGSAKGLTAPLPAGQLRAMRRAYAMAGFGPASVDLFEAHGTGTVAGDTAELESTMRLLTEDGARPRQAAIGSVKTLIGHTKAAAGVAGLMKAALALHHAVLPPHANVARPNGVLLDPAAPLYLLDEPMPWLAADGRPRRAACSAFGFGGTNFHVVLEAYAAEYRDWLRPPAADRRSAELLVWSDASRSALLARVEALAAALAGQEDLALRDLAGSLARAWRPGGFTLAIVARHVADLRTRLAAALPMLRGEKAPAVPGVYCGDAAQPAGGVAVLFSGQGSQYPGMIREAAVHFDCVRDALARADEELAEAFETRFGAAARLTHFIYPRGAYDEAAQSAAQKRLASTDVAQPALGAVEVALLGLMRSLGLEPRMYAGHSYGEFVALHAAGAIDFGALMRLSAARGRFIVDAASAAGRELGTMAAVNAPRAQVEQAIAGIEGVTLANHNGPQQSVISGTHAGVRAAAAKLAAGGVSVTDLPVAAAFHSSLVQAAQRPLADLIDVTPWSANGAPVYSNATGEVHAADPLRVKREMAEHLVRPVEFVAEIEKMYADGARVFLEIGPKSVLSRLVSRILAGRAHVAVSVDDGTGGIAGFLGAVAQLLCAGIPLDIAPLFARRDCRAGDPAQPATLRRTVPMAKYAWLINGSGARRAAEPARPKGVTSDSRPAAAAPAAAAVPQPEPAAPARDSERPLFAFTPSKKANPVDERRSPPGPADSSVVTQYFETMRQFLATQERVVAVLLGDAGAARPAARPRALTFNASRAAELAAAPAIVPTAQPYVRLPAGAPASGQIGVELQIPTSAAPAAAPAPAAAHKVNGANGSAAAHGANGSAAAHGANGSAAAHGANGSATLNGANGSAKAHAANGTGHSNGNGSAETLTREHLCDVLLGIVVETTGYPRDMLGLDQNLEADLGIDSIKRVEIAGALLALLPQSRRDALAQTRGELMRQPTLNGMLDWVTKPASGTSGGASGPFDSAGTEKSTEVVGGPSRLILRAQRESITTGMARRLTPGLFLLTRDAATVADALAAALRERGAETLIIERDTLADEAQLIERCRRLETPAPIAGIVHLAPLGAQPLPAESAPSDWRAALGLHEKSLFLLLRELSPRLAAGAHIVSASDLGGLYGRDGSSNGALLLQGGAPGLLKSLLQEREDLRVKAVDLDPGETPAARAAALLDEIELDGGRQEVGYPGGRRTVFHTVADDGSIDAARDAQLTNLVVLVTGGARGITAETLREIARPGNTLLLTGRTALPETEPDETRAHADAAALRRHYISQVRAGTLKLTPSQVEQRVQAVLGLREMRANIADFRASGAAVEYHPVDVTDEQALRALIEDARRRHGRIDGVVHGAGIIEDRLLTDKSSEGWSRVVETKVIGLLLLQKLIEPAALKFLTVFSSVAGRYGNSGQSDYATANELMNRICAALQSRWGDRVTVSALCWGPWGPTKFGAGMVTPQTEAKFAARGVSLVSAALGRRLFRQALARDAASGVEIICGAGPWESEEVRRGAIRPAPEPAEAAALAPLLASAAVSTGATGKKTLRVPIDPSRHFAMQGSGPDGRTVLAAAAAREMLAEAARVVWPRWRVARVSELEAVAGVELAHGERELQIHLSPPPYGSSEGFLVSAAISTDAGKGELRLHYRGVVHLEQPRSAPPEGAAA